MNTAVFAHQGGWDEFLMVAGPLLFLSFVVWLAARRFKSVESAKLSAGGDSPDNDSPGSALPGSVSQDSDKTFKISRDSIEEVML